MAALLLCSWVLHLASALATTLGCRLNQAQTAHLSGRLTELGYGTSRSAGEADVIVVNTCAVTREAERKACQHLRRLRREAPGAFLVVTGCYAELDGGLSESGLADLALGNEGKRRFIEAPERFLPRGDGVQALEPASRRRTRALVRVQEGCDNRCT